MTKVKYYFSRISRVPKTGKGKGLDIHCFFFEIIEGFPFYNFTQKFWCTRIPIML